MTVSTALYTPGLRARTPKNHQIFPDLRFSGIRAYFGETQNAFFYRGLPSSSTPEGFSDDLLAPGKACGEAPSATQSSDPLLPTDLCVSLCEAQIPFHSVYVEVGGEGEAVRCEEGEEVAALGGGGGAGLGAFEGGEVGEGFV